MAKQIRWKIKPHTLAKHQILKEYLAAWYPILQREFSTGNMRRRPIQIIDAFAASGKYLGGEEGSPLIELDSILNHKSNVHGCPIDFIFIEKDPDAYKLLQEEIHQKLLHSKCIDRVAFPRCFNGEAESTLWELLKNPAEFGPAFVFLDQFGYSNISINLISELMRHPSTECFIYLNWQRMRPYMTDKQKESALCKTFGGTEWKEALSIKENEKANFICNLYEKCLKEKANVAYTWDFAMCDKTGQLQNWLFFCTNSIRGLEEMKRAMWKVDATGEFQFSDRLGLEQIPLLSSYDDTMLRNDLMSNFKGQTVSVRQIKEFVLTETPAFLYATLLRSMEKAGNIKTLNGIKIRYSELADLDKLVVFNDGPFSQPKFSSAPIQMDLF